MNISLPRARTVLPRWALVRLGVFTMAEQVCALVLVVLLAC